MSKLKTTQTTNYQFDNITCEQNPNMTFKEYVFVDNNENWTRADEVIKSVEDGMTTNKADLVNVKSDIVEIKEKIKEGIKGDKGDRGQSAYEVAVGEGFIGTVDKWLESLKGDKGDPGVNGKNIELQKSSTHIQWRVAGEGSWNDLVALSDLKASGEGGGSSSGGEITNITINGVSPNEQGQITLTAEHLNAVDKATFQKHIDGEPIILTPSSFFTISEQKNYKTEKYAYINFKFSMKNGSKFEGAGFTVATLPFLPKGANFLYAMFYSPGNYYSSSEIIPLKNGIDLYVSLKEGCMYCYISAIICI